MPLALRIPDRPPASWWDEESFLYGMRAALSPALLAYVQEVLLGRFKIEPKGKRLLDLGCGGGWLAEEMRRIGFRTTGLDASAEAIAAATRHAEESALGIDYHLARGEDIPFADDAFDVVLLCGVLEQVAEIDAVLAEVARVLKKGGVLLFSDFNRTERSRAMVSLLERRDWTRAAPPGTFDWPLFVDPEGLRQALHRRGVERREIVG
ncbi:MAG: bifunctional 2-polyprenyl-6-hydroxyphenol methylase/3-demethylubiquinol 3-O-methyltransferase UbiG, partial [Candidatus Methylomirabilis sp.]|nr:bifunctional 2-polyprenyl-6-hydroxyphenol methylase/3-demethylubiquinol 3-O-methyltransferase UbiG [Deltaproteobacteria bacterium]